MKDSRIIEYKDNNMSHLKEYQYIIDNNMKLEAMLKIKDKYSSINQKEDWNSYTFWKSKYDELHDEYLKYNYK